MLKADANGLPVDATNTDTDVASAVSLKHTQNTDTGTNSTTFRVGAGADDDIYYYAQNADANKPYLHYNKTSNKWFFSNDGSAETEMAGPGGTSFATAAEALAGAAADKASAPSVSREMVINLKPVINAAVNKLDIFTKSSGATPDASNPIKVMIPDGNGYTQRTATAEAAQIIMADVANYWSKGSLDAEIKTAWLYAAWSTADSKLVWMLRGYSGFNMVSTSTTNTDDDFCLLPDGSAYSKAATDYCVAVAKIRYQYDTADTPDHTIQATGENAPQVIWNPKSDYSRRITLPTTVASGGNIAEQALISATVKQSGTYRISGQCYGDGGGAVYVRAYIRTGSATYGSAAVPSTALTSSSVSAATPAADTIAHLNTGEAIHLGGRVSADSGTRHIYGDDSAAGHTQINFNRID